MTFCVKVSNIATNFVVKRCKYKYWIAFCRCSRAIWIASERRANFHAPLIHMAREHRQNAIQCLINFVISRTKTTICHLKKKNLQPMKKKKPTSLPVINLQILVTFYTGVAPGIWRWGFKQRQRKITANSRRGRRTRQHRRRLQCSCYGPVRFPSWICIFFFIQSMN